MIKFIHKKHMLKGKPPGKFVIYYSLSDIVLGFLLIIFVGFFMVNYLKNNLYHTPSSSRTNTNQAPNSPRSRAQQGKF